MTISGIDWCIVGLSFVFLIVISWATKKQMKSVAGFISGERVAGRYLLTMAGSMAFVSVIAMLGQLESNTKNGFGPFWWMMMTTPVPVIISLSGWVHYRFRETRVLTMPQLFEVRYSRKFRVFAGLIAFVSGVLNCAVFPLFTAKFFMYFCGFPEHFGLLGISISTFHLIMFIEVAVGIGLALAGGQITVMVTDFFAGFLTNASLVLTSLYLVYAFGWNNLVDTLLDVGATAEGSASLVNPFNQGNLRDFGFMYFICLIINIIFRRGAWQGSAGYQVAAKSPHEMRMANIIGSWRSIISITAMIMFALFAVAFIHSADFAVQGGEEMVSAREHAVQVVENIDHAKDQVRMVTPVALSHVLPVGLAGIFLVFMIYAAVSTDDSAYHSWGTILLQDVILPFRKKAFSKDHHILMLRICIALVGIWAFVFSSLFTIEEFINMWFQITMNLFVGGAGIALIGALYWSRGTTSGAWAGMVTGSVVSVFHIVSRNYFKVGETIGYLRQTGAAAETARAKLVPFLPGQNPEATFDRVVSFVEGLPGGADGWLADFLAMNGMQASVVVILVSSLLYVVVSLLTCRERFNMDRLLHRGEFAVGQDHQEQQVHVSRFMRAFGITREFTGFDKFIYFSQLGWIILWLIVFIVGMIINVPLWKDATTGALSDDFMAGWERSWANWWGIQMGIFGAAAVIFTIWFSAGGVRDLVRMFKALQVTKVDEHDDGTVARPDAAKTGQEQA